MEALRVPTWLRQHWFYALLPLWAAAAINFHLVHPWQQQPRLGEAVVLFDLCLFVPALYVLCYRKQRVPRVVALRVVALVCAGIWIAGRMVPDGAETLLRDWGWLRGIGIAVLAMGEVAAVVVMFRIVFSKTPDPKALIDSGIPPLIARMMLAETRFWRWLFSRLRP